MSGTVLGIDLGTTNCALAFADAPEGEGRISPSILELPQVVKAGDVQPRPVLPSFLYLAEPGELPEGAMSLPWAKERDFAVGAFARDRGSEVPLHLVSSAKSWLCHGGVDRRAPILPPGSVEGARRVSPVTASVRYLEHMKSAWASARPELPVEHLETFLAVPASFDAVARELTLEAATAAGLGSVTLVEEPQAAFYAWLAQAGEAWRKLLKPKDRILVCDVGGGTSDFSLIEVKDDGRGNLALERVAVGDHLLLGGDNMDLALAHHLAGQLAKEGKKLDAGQQRALVLASRRAKEQLLGDPNQSTAPITILGRGTKLIGGQIKTELQRADLERILVEGFFPVCRADEKPQQARRTGFLELGLPFVSDPAITRHLAAFLSAHKASAGPPTHVLFNGGVFNSPLLRERLIQAMGAWASPPKVLEGADNDLAVAKGAAYFGLARSGRGIRIRGGAARSYYVGIETAAPAVPGVPPPVRAVCVVPFGMEEGTEAKLPGGELGLVVGEPVEFRLFSSTTRKNDPIGTVLDEYTWPDHLVETAPVSTKLEAEDLEPGSVIPVRLESKLSEIGTLELWSVSTDGRHRFRLEFNVRDREEA